MNSKQVEQEKLRQGLTAMGLDSGCTIVFVTGADLVADTAYRILRRIFTKAGVPAAVAPKPTGRKDLILGTPAVSETIREMCQNGRLRIGEVSAEDDGFEIKAAEDGIILAGANGRGVLYAVFEFEDHLFAGAHGVLDRFVVPATRKRSHGIGYYWNGYQGMIHDEFTEEKAEYMARLRINQYHGIQDGAGYGPHFFNLVKSPVLPGFRDPDPEYVRKTKKTSRIMREYGIDYFQWLIEPVLPYFGGNVREFPPEVFGRKEPAWWIKKAEGMEKTLCINKPLVQEYYFDAAKRFAVEYPDVKGVFLYNNDCEAWFCNPCECEACQKAAVDPVGGRGILWENEMRLQNIIHRGLKAGRADAETLFWPTVHLSNADIAKLLAETTGYSSLATGWDGGDHDAMMAAAADEPAFAVRITQEYEKKMHAPLYLYFAFNRTESLPQGFPYPYQMAAAVSRAYRWGIRNTVEGPGLSAHCNSINGLVMKAVETDPALDVSAYLAEICRAQFGEEAGKLMFEAFGEIKKGMDVWNENRLYPFRGSCNQLSMGPIMNFPESINIDKPGDLRDYLKTYASNSPYIYLKGEEKARTTRFIDQLRENVAHFRRASELAKRAAECAPADRYIGYAYYDVTVEGLERPSCREYAEMNYSVIRIAAMFGESRVNLLRSVELTMAMDAAADESAKKALHKEHTKLVEKDMAHQQNVLAMFEEFRQRPPYLTRVGITGRQIEDLIRRQREKLEDLADYLRRYEDER